MKIAEKSKMKKICATFQGLFPGSLVVVRNYFVFAGEHCQMTEDKILSISAESLSEDREDENLYDEDGVKDVSAFSEVHGIQRSKRRLKQSGVEYKVVTTRQKLSAKTDEVSGAVENMNTFQNH